VGVGVAAGNLAPPAVGWSPVLAILAVASAWCGLRRRGGGTLWWLASGLIAGGVACALAPRAPATPSRARMPVTFTAVVRDGWRPAISGWETRIRLSSVEAGRRRLRTAREVLLDVGGGHAPAGLPAPGSRVEGAGELAFDAAWPLARPRIRVKSALLLRPLGGVGVVDRMREVTVDGLESGAGVDPRRIRAAGLAAALVLGRRELLSGGRLDALRRSGLAHLLAVSGLHVGMVAGLAWALLGVVGVAPRTRRWLLLIVLGAFALLAGGGAPVRRAALAAGLYLSARQLGRPLLGLPTIAAVIAGLLLAEPAALLEPSFQLSAVVTLALVRWVAPLAIWLRPWLRRFAPAVAVALVAQATSSPLLGHHFGAVPLLAAPANLAAVPVGFVAVAVSLLAALAGLLLGVLALLGDLLDLFARAAVAGSVPCPPLPDLLAFALAALGVLALSASRRARAGGLFAAVVFPLWLLVPWPRTPRGWELRLLPVRDGAAVLVRHVDAAFLVDAGSSPREAARALRGLGVRRLAALVLTHTDSDHTGGAAEVMRTTSVGAVVFPALAGERSEIVELRRLARSKGIAEVGVVRGIRLHLAECPCDVLWPGVASSGNDNDDSLVMRCTAGGVGLLLAGDVEASGERALLAAGPSPLRADLLQLPHHGSRTSSTPALLAAVRPVVGVAATGRAPRFAFPAPVVVDRVQRLPAVVVSQSGGVEAVAWQQGGPLEVGTCEPVTVNLARRP
jgi:competence protein ComEC